MDEAVASLKKSSETVRLLERDLTGRTERLQKLRTEHAKLTELTKISQEQAKALADLLQQTIGKGLLRRKRPSSIGVSGWSVPRSGGRQVDMVVSGTKRKLSVRSYP